MYVGDFLQHVPAQRDRLQAIHTPKLLRKITGSWLVLYKWDLLLFLVGESPASECQTPGNHPKERIQHSEQGESWKSRKRI